MLTKVHPRACARQKQRGKERRSFPREQAWDKVYLPFIECGTVTVMVFGWDSLPDSSEATTETV